MCLLVEGASKSIFCYSTTTSRKTTTTTTTTTTTATTTTTSTKNKTTQKTHRKKRWQKWDLNPHTRHYFHVYHDPLRPLHYTHTLIPSHFLRTKWVLFRVWHCHHHFPATLISPTIIQQIEIPLQKRPPKLDFLTDNVEIFTGDSNYWKLSMCKIS